MSKKDLIALADAIKNNRAAFSDAALNTLASFCRSQNAAFNEYRWRGYINDECGPNGGAIKKTES